VTSCKQSLNEERREMHIKSQAENLKGRDRLGDISLYGMIILKCILREEGFEDVDCICMAQNRVQ
jgi:hypothetical protein